MSSFHCGQHGLNTTKLTLKRNPSPERQSKKRPDLSEKTVVVVNQFTEHVETFQRRGWYPISSNPTIETAKPWKSMTVLGAVTNDGDSLYCWTKENLTRHHGIQLIEALNDNFGEELVVILNRTGYYYAKDICEHVSGERETETVGDSSVLIVHGDDLEVLYFPSKLSELNAVEEFWDHLQERFKYLISRR